MFSLPNKYVQLTVLFLRQVALHNKLSSKVLISNKDSLQVILYDDAQLTDEKQTFLFPLKTEFKLLNYWKYFSYN